MPGSDAKPLLYALDWAKKENERPCSQYELQQQRARLHVLRRERR
jgi:hypothetical protein